MSDKGQENYEAVLAALRKDNERVLRWAADQICYLGSKAEWSMSDNFGCTESLAALTGPTNLPDAYNQDGGALLFYGLAARHLGYDVELDEPLAQQVINRFVELAPEWVTSWEYPGIFTLRLDHTHELCTALNGWHYATINRLNTDDNSWEPDPDNESLSIDFECTAPGHNDDPDSCTCIADAETLADAIETAALGWQEAHRG